MSWYNERMFQSSLYQELPVKKKKSRSESNNSLQQKLTQGRTFSEGLGQDDIDCMVKEVT